MSNAMSLSKSRWKGALLATVAASVLTPLAANAQTMTLSLSLSPLGDTLAYGGPGFTQAAPGQLGGYGLGPAVTEVIPPDQVTPIYVYATVTGTSAPSASYVDGLQYVYFNVLSTGGINGSEGTISSTIPNAALGFNGNGSQNGSAGFTSGSTSVGSTSLLTSVSKPRSARPVYSTNTSGGQLTSDGTNVIISGNSISFLIETLMYTPATTDSSYSANGGVTNSFTIAPQSTLTGLLNNTSNGIYAAANYMVGLPANPGFNTGAGASFTYTNYNVSSSGVNLVDAEPGDALLAGVVVGSDLNVILGNFEKGITGWTNGQFVQGDSEVDGSDINDTLGNFEKPYSTPAGGFAGPDALIGGSPVPEPSSLALLSFAGLSLARRRNRRVQPPQI